jgi:anti-sigma factor RsiW
MSCDNVQELISPLLDQKVSAGERENVLAHLESCKQCSAQLESMQKARAILRGMNDVPVPPALTAKLRVVASHERERRLRGTPAKSLRYWSDRAQLWFDNLMRPVFLPLAGGILSAAMIFCVLVPTLSFQSIEAALTADGQVVPGDREATMIGTVVLDSGSAYAPVGGDAPKIQPVYSESPDDANIAWLAIDENGKVTGCSVTKGQLTPDMQNRSSHRSRGTHLGTGADGTAADTRTARGPQLAA